MFCNLSKADDIAKVSGNLHLNTEDISYTLWNDSWWIKVVDNTCTESEGLYIVKLYTEKCNLNLQLKFGNLLIKIDFSDFANGKKDNVKLVTFA